MTRARVLAALWAAGLAACSFVRSLDGYSDQYGQDAGGDSSSERCNACGAIQVLATDQVQPHGIVVDATHVYWTNEGNGTVSRCLLDGCNGHPEILAQRQAVPTEIALRQGVLFWANAGGTAFGTCSVDLCLADVLGDPAGPGAPVAVALVEGPYGTTTAGDIFACPGLTGCSPFGSTFHVIASGQKEPRGIALATTATRTIPIWAARGAGAIMKCGDRACGDGGGPTPLAADEGAVERVAVDAKNVYWANDVAIRRCSIEGCTSPVTIADGQTGPRGLAIDDANVYWTNGDATVRACPTAGCPKEGPTIIAAEQDDPQGIAVTSTHVYWVSRGKGTVARRPTR